MIEWLKPKNGGRGSRTEYISISVNKSGSVASGNVGALSLCIRFSEAASADLRLVAGDRLNIGFDHMHSQIAFKRTNIREGSYKLSSPKGSVILSVQAKTDLPWHESIDVPKKNVRIEGGHVAIDAGPIFGVEF